MTCVTPPGSALIAPWSYTATLQPPRKRPKRKLPKVAAPPSAAKRPRIGAGRLVKVVEPDPCCAAKFCAVTVIVIGPSGTPVKPRRENVRVVPVPFRPRTEVKGGAVDSGGRK